MSISMLCQRIHTHSETAHNKGCRCALFLGFNGNDVNYKKRENVQKSFAVVKLLA